MMNNFNEELFSRLSNLPSEQAYEEPESDPFASNEPLGALEHDEVRLIEYFDNEKDWTKGKLRWRQCLQGFVIGVFKKFDNQAMDLNTIVEHVKPVRSSIDWQFFRMLKRRDGSYYFGEIT